MTRRLQKHSGHSDSVVTLAKQSHTLHMKDHRYNPSMTRLLSRRHYVSYHQLATVPCHVTGLLYAIVLFARVCGHLRTRISAFKFPIQIWDVMLFDYEKSEKLTTWNPQKFSTQHSRNTFLETCHKKTEGALFSLGETTWGKYIQRNQYPITGRLTSSMNLQQCLSSSWGSLSENNWHFYSIHDDVQTSHFWI